MKLKHSLRWPKIGVATLLITIFLSAFYLAGYKRRFINPPLVHAAGNNEIEEVEQLLAKGHCVDDDNNYGDTALHYACFASDTPVAVDMIRLLLEHYADVRKENNDGIAPMIFLQHLDDIQERMDVMGDLIKHGAEINAIVGARESLLSRTVRAREQYAVQKMIEHWGDLISDSTLEYAKNLAYAREKDPDIVVTGDPGFTDIDEDVEQDPLASSMEKAYTHESFKSGLGYSDIAETIESTEPKPGLHGLDPLMVAVIQGDKEKVADHLENGHKIHATSDDRYKYTPLHYAVIHRDPEMVNLLLVGEYKANPAVTAEGGNTPLHMTILAHSEDLPGIEVAWKMIKLLVDNGANINAKNDAGDTVLHIAVRKRHGTILERIIKGYHNNIDRKVTRSILDLARTVDKKGLWHKLRSLL